MTSKQKNRVIRPSRRDELLRRLRAESQVRSHSRYSHRENTLLVGLARTARYSTRRSIRYLGVRFPLRVGLWLDVLDPETGKVLISTNGGLL